MISLAIPGRSPLASEHVAWPKDENLFKRPHDAPIDPILALKSKGHAGAGKRVGPPGFEPGLPAPKAGVLPLDDGPVTARRRFWHRPDGRCEHGRDLPERQPASSSFVTVRIIRTPARSSSSVAARSRTSDASKIPATQEPLPHRIARLAPDSSSASRMIRSSG